MTEIEEKMQEPQPSTSGLNNKGGPIELSSEDSQLFSDVELTDDEDVCCVCNKSPSFFRSFSEDSHYIAVVVKC
jgi:hypothetical protein